MREASSEGWVEVSGTAGIPPGLKYIYYFPGTGFEYLQISAAWWEFISSPGSSAQRLVRTEVQLYCTYSMYSYTAGRGKFLKSKI
jgi:hypothetical protein